MRMTTICAGILLLVAPVYAASADTGPPDAASALARLKSLVGEWEGKSDMGEARLVYEAIAGGSAVVEREIVGEMPPRPRCTTQRSDFWTTTTSRANGNFSKTTG